MERSELCRLFQFDGRCTGGEFDIFGPAEAFENADGDPVHIELIPFSAVSRRGRPHVVIIVPAFAERQDGDEPVVGREIAGVVRPFAVDMSERIDEPCRMPTDNDACENAPNNHRPSANGKQNDR